MLAFNLGITKQSNKWVKNRVIGTTNRGKRDYKQSSLNDLKSGQKDYKLGQGFQIGGKRFQVGAEITNRSKRDYKLGQEFQTGAGITNQ